MSNLEEKQTQEQIEMETETGLDEAMAIIDVVIAGLMATYGGQIAASAMSGHFFLMLGAVKKTGTKKDMEEIMEAMKQELEKINVDITYKVNCCPHKKKEKG